MREVDLIKASLGKAGIHGLDARTAKSKRSKDAEAAVKQLQQLKDKFRIYFPSQDTVARSRGGRAVSSRVLTYK
jgi:hypothetical protein